jgi:tetratricopeptide (TPR) repeat protein
LVSALDDWALATADPHRRAWVLEAARRAEPDPWGDRFRDPAVWGDRTALERLAEEANVADLSPRLLTALGAALLRSGADSVPLLAAAQRRNPTDFWLLFLLGNALEKAKSGESVEYYRAALAVRPEASAVYNNLGAALHRQGRLDKAIREYRTAIGHDHTFALAHTNLGVTLAALGRLDDAIQEYHTAIALDPHNAQAHYNLGTALHKKGRPDDAIAAYRRAIGIDPEMVEAHGALAQALLRQGQSDEPKK